MFCKYVLQRRQGHHSGFHSLIAIYKTGIYKTPMYKTGTKTSKFNYRPVSILSNISKIYERLMFEQILGYFEPILSKFPCGFRKGISAEHCLLSMQEKWKVAVNNKKTVGSLLSNLSKDFD